MRVRVRVCVCVCTLSHSWSLAEKVALDTHVASRQHANELTGRVRDVLKALRQVAEACG